MQGVTKAPLSKYSTDQIINMYTASDIRARYFLLKGHWLQLTSHDELNFEFIGFTLAIILLIDGPLPVFH